MSDQPRDNLEVLVNASVDGTLTDQQRAEFAAVLQSDEFHQAIALQRRIDESVGRQFAAPDPEKLLRSAMNGRSQSFAIRHPASGAGSRLQAIAAGILLAVLGAAVAWQLWPDEQIRQPAHQSIEQLYADTVKAGFKPIMAYKEDRALAIATYSRLGKAVLPSGLSSDVKLIGFGYCNSISEWTVSLMATAGDKKIMLFIDRADHDNGQKLSPGSPLHLAGRRVDDMVLYEISPLDKPLLLNHFGVISMPPDWLRRDQCDE
jgi:hypothetical protein